MTRKSKARGGRQQSQESVQQSFNARIGVPNSTDAKKTRSINVLQGITPLELNNAAMEQETPVKLMHGGEMEHNSSGKQSWADVAEKEVEHKDKVAQVNRGLFLVRFTQAESRMKVLEEGVQMFNKKPVIIKPWSPDIDTRKDSFSTVPIWIRFPGLDIKYWGKTALIKIAGLVGKPLKADRATTWKERMTFARVLVEVTLDHPYPQTIMFEMKLGKLWSKGCIMSGSQHYARSVANKKEWEEVQNSAEKDVIQNKVGTEEGKQRQTEKEQVVTGSHQDNRREGKKAIYIQKGSRAQRGKDVPGSSINLGNSFGALGENSSMMLMEQEKERLSKQVQVEFVSAQMIHCEVTHRGTGMTISVSMVYGFNDPALRRTLWQEVRNIKNNIKGPWALMGDFNCVLNKEDRVGRPVTMAEIREFRECIGECGLQELRSSGAFYTWNNKQEGEDRVYSRIDRVLVNIDWIITLPVSEVHYMNEGLFDHCLAIINWDKGKRNARSQFKYFNMWKMASDFKERVKQSWEKRIEGIKMFKVIGKMNRLKAVLTKLNKERFAEVERKADQALEELKKCQAVLQQDGRNKGLIESEIQLTKECRMWGEARDTYLRQKSRMQWLTKGDQNTKFFHSAIKERRNMNRIFSVVDTQGVARRDTEEVSQAFIEFYEKLLGEKNENRKNVEDVKAAVWSIVGDKAPGPDGYTSQFFKDCWEIVNKDVVEGGVLPGIISANQSAFVAGRSIVQNVLICQDLVRLYNRKASVRSCLIKIDLRKAYDTVEWDFVREMLHVPHKFIHWIMQCITTTRYSIALNGGVYGNIEGKRGLRQGDPISPLIFVICMEYFTRIMQQVTTIQGFEFHTKCRGLKLNHLCFADDVLLFCKGEMASVMLMLRGLAAFSEATGLRTNAAKSNIYSANMNEQDLVDLCDLTGYKRGYVQQDWLAINGKYTIKSGYSWKQGRREKWESSRWVWSRNNIPKHSFICWLAMHRRFLTRERYGNTTIQIGRIVEKNDNEEKGQSMQHNHKRSIGSNYISHMESQK
ncbi:PREDICTED: uncharacterized protein LOC109231421 [Nicotiana attenuata]|uniref:uncharacterized protein LOC109231421 n=1 Tax=Nicotiana attenuata TaxID=49451 RepID=UPI00090484D1|nr:PREDICTED: uncharacterized protein LOC109231421 [Nicotiana attenuata]